MADKSEEKKPEETKPEETKKEESKPVETKTENKIINNEINDTNSQIEEITKMNKTSKYKNEEKTEKETEYEKEQNKYKTQPITQISKYEKPSTPKLKYNLPEYKQNYSNPSDIN